MLSKIFLLPSCVATWEFLEFYQISLLFHKADGKKKDVITNESSSVNNKSRQLERSYLEEILIKEDVEPKTTSEKVGKAASNTFAYFAFALGVCALGGLGYALFDSFFGSDSPQKIYSKCLKLIKNDERCIQLFGSGLKGYGEESGRGRRRHIANHAYEKDGQQRVRVMFHLKGDRAKGRAYAEVAKVEGVWDYRFLYVESIGRGAETIVLIDNRS